MTTRTTPEARAFIAGLDARSEVQRIMASPEYRAGDLAAHAKVRAHFLEAYGEGSPAGTAMGPGEVPANPFGR
ncbi:hypothetical protein AAFN86_11605 [Roseomonas sp. CAU 1739]|uniref:hypothetical protein n=1 Tax=Roseomonas sp. CAU 1739 TaxID=3140364 RepID=UPI00325BE8AC